MHCLTDILNGLKSIPGNFAHDTLILLVGYLCGLPYSSRKKENPWAGDNPVTDPFYGAFLRGRDREDSAENQHALSLAL
jgi:hypothetical protein